MISCDAQTAASGRAKTVDSPDNYAWIEAINSPVYINMRPGMYTGPTVQVSPNFNLLYIPPSALVVAKEDAWMQFLMRLRFPGLPIITDGPRSIKCVSGQRGTNTVLPML